MKARFLINGVLGFAALFLSAAEAPAPAAPKPMDVGGIEKFFQLSTNLYSGAAPEDDKAFTALQKLGVKTIISVDGSKPNVELAHKYGIHYIHLPHGYDGIPAKTELRLVKAARTAPGPIFIHCHHGMHRGPTAAAVICMADNGWTAAQAEAFQKTAGTATNYTGLFETVRRFKPPTAAEVGAIPADFEEVAKLPGLVDAMVAIDEQWDILKAVRKAGYQAPKNHPDAQPAGTAVILTEHFRESQRLDDSVQRGPEFLAKLQFAEKVTREAEAALREFATAPTAENKAGLDRRFDALAQTCSGCHKFYRDRKP